MWRTEERQRLFAVFAVFICLCIASADDDHSKETPAGAHMSRYEMINSRPGNVLVLILTDCANYSDWQTLAAAFAWRQSGQPGSVVRVANCGEEDTNTYDKNMLGYVKTHMAPQFGWNEELQDWYAAYNKPGAVLDYFNHNDPPEEWMVVLDSDMLLRKPFLPEELPLQKGWAYAGHYDYLIGTDNELALRHVPEVSPRNDTTAGRFGRRGDRVGGPYFMHRDDLRRLAPQWLNYSKLVRADMEAYKDSGDDGSKPGERIWIAEMYGYSFGAAKSDIWHIWREDFVLYPSYEPYRIPYVLHYGLVFDVGGWHFDKHSYFDFDSRKCPPWDLETDRPNAGIFPPPPAPTDLENKDFQTRYKDMLAVSVIAIANAALCDYHVRNCPPSPQLTEVCNQAFKLWYEVDQEIKDLEWKYNCTDHNDQCARWASQGECTSQQKEYMADHCRVSCKYSEPQGGSRPKTGPNDAKPMSVEELSEFVGKKAATVIGTGSDKPSQLSMTHSPSPAPEPGPTPPPKSTSSQQWVPSLATSPAKLATPSAAPASKALKPAPNTDSEKPDDKAAVAEMLKEYPPSTLSFAALIKRCTFLQGLTDQQMKDCVKAASLKLKYPGIAFAPQATTTAVDAAPPSAAKAPSNASPAVLDYNEEHGINGARITREIMRSREGSLDLASLHALHTEPAKQYEMRARNMSGPDDALSFVEQAFIMLLVVCMGSVVYKSLQKYCDAYNKSMKAFSRSE